MATTTTEAFTTLLQSAIYKQLLTQSGNLQHTNTDGIYTPARWWYDTADISKGGCILQTTANMTPTYNNNILQVDVNLDYIKQQRISS